MDNSEGVNELNYHTQCIKRSVEICKRKELWSIKMTKKNDRIKMCGN